jgi:hypothetical protein
MARQAPSMHSQMKSSWAMSTDQVSGWPKKRMIAATKTSPVIAASSSTQIASSIWERRFKNMVWSLCREQSRNPAPEPGETKARRYSAAIFCTMSRSSP